jgi:hypothetical protein
MGDANEKRAERIRERADKVMEDSRERMDEAEAASKGDDLTETESKNKFRAEMLDGAIQDIEEVLDSGYNTGGFEALKDKAVAATDLTRWAASDEGLKFKSAANTAKEQILRAATGAAAPETENQEYIETLVPRVGEGREVVEYKLQKMREAQALLAELGGDNWNEAISMVRQGDDMYRAEQDRGQNRRQRRESRANRNQPAPQFTEQDIDNMSLEELKANGLI